MTGILSDVQPGLREEGSIEKKCRRRDKSVYGRRLQEAEVLLGGDARCRSAYG
jgi:hypothetical protein